MADEKQLQDAVERLVKKLNTARLSEVTSAVTEQGGEVQPHRGFSNAEEARESEKSTTESVVDAKTAAQPTGKLYSGLVSCWWPGP